MFFGENLRLNFNKQKSNSCNEKVFVSPFLKFVGWQLFAIASFLLLLLAANRLLNINISRNVLVFVTVFLELVILFKTAMNDIPKIFSNSDIEDITCNYKLKTYYKKLTSIYLGVVQSQIFTVAPFFVAYALIRNADLIFYFNCALAILSIAVIISIWALLVFGAVRIIKKSCNKLSRTHEILLIVAFMVISVIGAVVSKGVSFESIIFHIMDIFKQAIFLIQTFAVTINSHIILCVNIVAIYLIAQGLVAFVLWFFGIVSKQIDIILQKNKFFIKKDCKKYKNSILRSCLARSPTLV